MGKENSAGVICAVHLAPTWAPQIEPDPRAGVDAMRERAAEARLAREELVRQIESLGSRIYKLAGEFNQRYAASRYQRTQVPWMGRWTWLEPTVVIAMTLGAPKALWDESTSMWWFDKNHHVLDWVQSPADVARIPIPDWQSSPHIAEMLASRARWKEAFPDEPARIENPLPLVLPGGRWVWAGAYPSFVDMGICLFGITGFMALLAGDPETADALLDKCFELCTSYSEFFHARAEEKLEGWYGFGGDVCTMLSPRIYEKYGVGWETRLFEYVRQVHKQPADMPWNLHSCGPSKQLYDVWGRHPYRRNVACMQTRFIPGQVKRLRQNLPTTHLQITVHPPQFDFAHAQPEEVKRMLRESAEGAGYRDVSFNLCAVAHQLEDLPGIEANVQACDQVMSEIND